MPPRAAKATFSRCRSKPPEPVNTAERTLEQHGEGARLVEVVLFRVDGKVLRLSAATSRAVRDAALIRRLPRKGGA